MKPEKLPAHPLMCDDDDIDFFTPNVWDSPPTKAEPPYMRLFLPEQWMALLSSQARIADNPSITQDKTPREIHLLVEQRHQEIQVVVIFKRFIGEICGYYVGSLDLTGRHEHVSQGHNRQ